MNVVRTAGRKIPNFPTDSAGPVIMSLDISSAQPVKVKKSATAVLDATSRSP